MIRYTPLPTVVTGDLWSAADQNTYVADNFAITEAGLAGTAGGLLVGTDYQDGAVLPIGDFGETIRVDPSAPHGIAWSSKAIYASVVNGSGQSVSPSGTTPAVQQLGFPVVLKDDYSMYDQGSGCFTVPANMDGVWVATISGWIPGSSPDAGKLVQVGCQILQTNNLISSYRYRSFNMDLNGYAIFVCYSEMVYMTAGSKVWAIMTHQIGSAIQIYRVQFTLTLGH